MRVGKDECGTRTYRDVNRLTGETVGDACRRVVSFTVLKRYSFPPMRRVPVNFFFPQDAVPSVNTVNPQAWFTRLVTTEGLLIYTGSPSSTWKPRLIPSLESKKQLFTPAKTFFPSARRRLQSMDRVSRLL